MGRISTRLRQATKRPLPQDTEDEASDFASAAEVSSEVEEDRAAPASSASRDKGKTKRPVKKRQKTMTTTANGAEQAGATTKMPPAKRIRGKLGLLRDIAEMPLDVSFEIFSNLMPLDLLSLSRTTKTIRSIVLSPSAKGVWKAAFENVEGLPECPPHLSLPLFTSLLYEKTCHFCNKGGNTSTRALFEYGVRSCSRCILKKFWTLPTHRDSWAQMMWAAEIWLYLPEHEGKRSRANFMPRKLAVEYTEACLNFESKAEREQWLRNLKETWKDHDTVRQSYASWESQSAREIQEACNERRKQRKEEVFSRLRALGWDQELTTSVVNTINYVKGVDLPTKLTENTWKKLLPELTAILRAGKTARLAKELVEIVYPARNAVLAKLYNEYISSLPPDAYTPALCDVASFPEFRTITEDTPVATVVTEQHYSSAFAALPRLTKEWKDNLRLFMVKQLPPQWRVKGDTEEAYTATLARACVMFVIPGCYSSRPFFGLDVTQDPHLLLMKKEDRRTFEDIPPWANGLVGGHGRSWQYIRSDHENLVFSKRAALGALGLMLAYGVIEKKEGDKGRAEMQEKMKEITRAEMKKRGRVLCTLCDHRIQKPFDWDQAMHHTHEMHGYSGLSKSNWKLVDEKTKA